MRIGIVEIKTLKTVGETFGARWRVGVGLIFLVIACMWWGAIHRADGFEGIVTDDGLRPYTLALVGFIALGFAVILPRKGVFGRTLFLLAAGFISLSLLLLLVAAAAALAEGLSGPGPVLVLAGVLLAALLLCWKFLIPRMYALCQSLIPIGRWRAYRRQVSNSLRLWSGEWEGPDAPAEDGTGVERARRRRARISLAVAALAFGVGLLAALPAVVGLVNRDFPRAIYEGEFSKAWDILRGLQIQPPADSWAEEGSYFLSLLPFIVVGLVGFGVSGHGWVGWKRARILVYQTPLSERTTPSTILLLRSFADDIMLVPGRSASILMLPFRVYEWSYTFEQLIKERLACVGELRLLARVTKEDPEGEGAANSEGDRLRRGFLDRVKRAASKGAARVESIVKLSDLPALGGIRHETAEWREDILQSIPVARMIVVLFGVTENLQWEVDEIKARGFFEKTVFLMPPLGRSKSRRQRWEEFVARYLWEPEGLKKALLERVNPERILAVCHHQNHLVVITGELTQPAYEAALDVATILTLAPAPQSGEMIPRYIDVAAR